MSRSLKFSVILCGILLASLDASLLADDRVPTDPAMRWWKGNLHTHSFWSDGNDFPEMISEWYREQGYNFLAISDHNVLSQGRRWMKVDEVIKRGGKEVLPKYQSRFGGGWVELDGETGTADQKVRLKPLDEYRSLIEERGKFILIQSEEISDRAEGKPIHINAANITEVIEPQGGSSVRETIANNFRAILEQEREKGREILPHLNHPNFGWAITAEDIAWVTNDHFYEVYNGHPDINHLGDTTRPSVERIWDIANAIRLSQLKVHPLFGLGTDDSHHYHGSGGSRPGRGWIMVRSKYLTPERLIQAIKRGDFYASSGVTLAEVSFDTQSRTLNLQIDSEPKATYKTEFIGTKRPSGITSDDVDAVAEYPSLDQIGIVLATSEELTPAYQLADDDLYVRAVVTCSLSADDPSFEGQRKQAWTQPVGWKIDPQRVHHD